MLNERFQRFDFGETKNLEVYKQKTPPEIDLSQIKHVPIAMFWGNHDVIATVYDTNYTRDLIPKDLLVFHKVYDYGHISFWCAKDMSYIDDVDMLVKQYS